ncbi:hypothetical protein ACHAWF_016399 [Thalassiosira exigua]
MHKYDSDFNYQMECKCWIFIISFLIASPLTLNILLSSTLLSHISSFADIFVDVHFMLFYTAVFNAIQSCLLRLLAGYRTDRAWVRTEDIDIGHYVAIRNEYDRLERKFRWFRRVEGTFSPPRNSAPGASQSGAGSTLFGDDDNPLHPPSLRTSLRKAFRDLAFRVRHPRHHRRMNALLVPIRFHELRAHFIESNELSDRFKVSHYLKRSLTSVLLDFVHIHSAAWIMLMATANLMYFLSGMLLSVAKDIGEVSEFLTFTFVALMVAFICLAFVLYFKMRRVFSQILRMKLTVLDEDMGRVSFNTGVRVSTRRSVDQKTLFWWGNPEAIIVATQYMQFGYALGLAMIFTYYKEFEKYQKHLATFLLMAVVVSYLIFLHLLSKIIPWYTLCTSMGQLVNEEMLNETKAKLRLGEEIRKKESLEEERKAEEVRKNLEASRRAAEAKKLAEEARQKTNVSAENRAEFSSSARNAPSLANILKPNVSKLPSIPALGRSEEKKGNVLSLFRNKSSDALEGTSSRSSELDGTDRSRGSAFMKLITNRSSDALDATADIIRSGHARKKSVSDGVQFMGKISIDEEDHLLSHSGSSSPTKNVRLSSAAAQQLDSADEGGLRVVESMFDAEPKPSLNGSLEQLDRPVHSSGRRQRRMKSLSDGIGLMRAMNSAPPSADEKVSAFIAENAKFQPERPLALPQERHSESFSSLAEGPAPPGRRMSPRSSPRMSPRSSPSLAMLSINETEVTMGENPVPPKLAPDPMRLSASQEERKQRRRRMKTQSEGVATMRSSMGTPLDSVNEREPLSELTAMAQMSSKELRKVRRQSRPRPSRERSASEGVAFMRGGIAGASETESKVSSDDIMVGKTGNNPINGDNARPMSVRGISSPTLGREARKQRRRLTKTQSEGVAHMRANLPALSQKSAGQQDKLSSLTGFAQLSVKDLPEIPEYSNGIKSQRRPRKKSASGGVSSMRAFVTGDRTSPTEMKVPSAGKKLADTEKSVKIGQSEEEREAVLVSEAPAKAKVTFCLESSKPPCLDTITSIDSAASDDGESDIEDVPEAQLNEIEINSRQTLRDRGDAAAAFFQGHQYRIISFLFGPIACFFFVARVEIFNIYDGVFIDQTGVWKKMLVPSFWIELGLYCAMIVEMLTVLIVFLGGNARKSGTAQSCAAAVWGIVINIVCLSLLVVAEIKRCCPYNDNVFARLLGPSPSESYYDDPAAEEVECCPDFGSRRYGGLGNIEPLTCLIALSPLRFIVAQYVVKLLRCGQSHSELKHSEEHHGHHHGPDPTSTARALWLSAIGMHSDIAKSFGPFSGELLRAMLGIYSHEIIHAKENTPLTGDRYITDALNNEDTEQNSSKHHRRENSMDITSEESSREPLSQSFDFGATFSEFAYPRSRLIRRMRRCERRLTPLLDEWMLVDVVLTSHELILFDVSIDPDDALDSSIKHDASGHTNGGKGLQLCDVARGRKIVSQFNLDEVNFVDIEHREAIPNDISAIFDGLEGRDIESNDDALRESWQGASILMGDYDAEVMSKRWGHVDEDRLKIRFKYNTLFLRFMVDLKEMEHNRKALMDDPDLMHHVGKQTKLWCSTIARLRGAMNLKQDLPHFGDGGTGEIEDFIEMCPREEDSGHRITRTTIRKKLHRRISSLGGDN